MPQGPLFHYATKSAVQALKDQTGDRIMDATLILSSFIAVFAATGVLTAYWYAQ